MPIEFSPSEQNMWAKEARSPSLKPSDDEINAKYGRRELRIVTESNREQLPNFVEALKRPGWMKLRPPYQRRPRWDPLIQGDGIFSGRVEKNARFLDYARNDRALVGLSIHVSRFGNSFFFYPQFSCLLLSSTFQ